MISVLAIGAMSKRNRTGNVNVLELVDGKWVPRGQSVKGEEDGYGIFGGSVSLSGDGNVLAVGSLDLMTGTAGDVILYDFVPSLSTLSNAPSLSAIPSISTVPSVSEMPTIVAMPSANLTYNMTLSPEKAPYVSPSPSLFSTNETNNASITSSFPSISTAPSVSPEPTNAPTLSLAPSVSPEPTSNATTHDGTMSSMPSFSSHPSSSPSHSTNSSSAIVPVSPIPSSDKSKSQIGDTSSPSTEGSTAPSLLLSPDPYWHRAESVYSEFGHNRNNDYIGARVSLSKDGTTLVVGSPLSINTNTEQRTGHVKVFRRGVDRTWTLGETIHGAAELDHFGTSVSVSEFGNIIAVGADNFGSSFANARNEKSGFVEVYQFNNETWSLIGDRIYGTLCTDDVSFHDNFGRDVSLSNKGSVVAVGARGLACVLQQSDKKEWTLVGNVIGADSNLIEKDFGASVELAGDSMVVGIFERFAYTIYTLIDESSWERMGGYIETDTPTVMATSAPWLGKNLAISDDGITIATPNPTRIYHYHTTDSEWNEVNQVLMPTQSGENYSSEYTESVSLSQDGNVLAIGAITKSNCVGNMNVLELDDGENGYREVRV